MTVAYKPKGDRYESRPNPAELHQPVLFPLLKRKEHLAYLEVRQERLKSEAERGYGVGTIGNAIGAKMEPTPEGRILSACRKIKPHELFKDPRK